MVAEVSGTKRDTTWMRRQSGTTCAAVSKVPSLAMKKPVPDRPVPCFGRSGWTTVGSGGGSDDGGARNGGLTRGSGAGSGTWIGAGAARPPAAPPGFQLRQETHQHGAAKSEADRQTQQICHPGPHAGRSIPGGSCSLVVAPMGSRRRPG